jgi:hypothetical protein
VLYLRLIILSVGGDVPVDSEVFLVIDFVNFKIKSVQSFGGAHRDRICVCIYKGECLYVYGYLCFKKRLSTCTLESSLLVVMRRPTRFLVLNIVADKRRFPSRG